MTDDIIDILAEDMRELYDMIYPGGNWKRDFYRREDPHMKYRHMVRHLLYRERPANQTQVALAEHALLEERYPMPDRSSISHSCKISRKYLQGPGNEMWQKLTFFYDVIRDRGRTVNPDRYLRYIHDFEQEPEHAKSILLASLLHYGLVNKSIMRTLLNEYRTVDREFMNQLIQKYLGK